MDSALSHAVHGATSGNVALSAGPQLDAALLEALRGRATRVRAFVNAILCIDPFEDEASLRRHRARLCAEAAELCGALADELDVRLECAEQAWQLWACLTSQGALLDVHRDEDDHPSLRRRDRRPRNEEASAAGFLAGVALELADRLVNALEGRA